ncbi:MAG: hypothetical protein JEZ09_06555 [Salinivirgaceae bacterium]|nr:hypothetical protein [Salinivirgaceae bacterium]
MKKKIAIVKLGHIDHLLNIDKIKNWSSSLFEIVHIHCIDYLPDSDVEDGYLDKKYTRNGLSEKMKCPTDCDYAIGIMRYRFEDNFYLHRINKKCGVISLNGIEDILRKESISLENFIIKQIYEIVALTHLVGDMSSDEVYKYVHLDTRGCLFDMNGERTDILYNTEKPIICDSCREAFRKQQINSDVVKKLERELPKIRKPFIISIEKKIKKYPLLSVIISALVPITLSIIANLICELIE